MLQVSIVREKMLGRSSAQSSLRGVLRSGLLQLLKYEFLREQIKDLQERVDVKGDPASFWHHPSLLKDLSIPDLLDTVADCLDLCTETVVQRQIVLLFLRIPKLANKLKTNAQLKAFNAV